MLYATLSTYNFIAFHHVKDLLSSHLLFEEELQESVCLLEVCLQW